MDVEKIRPDVEYLELAERFFSTNEYQALSAMPSNQLARAFFACWTRKEAFIKACGDGLSFPLSEFSVSIDPDAPATLQEVRTPSRVQRRQLSNGVSISMRNLKDRLLQSKND